MHRVLKTSLSHCTRHMSHGTWHMAQGTWHMSHGTCHKAHGTRHMAQGNGTWHKAHGTRHMSHGKNAKILETYNLGSFKGKLPERQKSSLKLTELVGGVLVKPKI